MLSFVNTGLKEVGYGVWVASSLIVILKNNFPSKMYVDIIPEASNVISVLLQVLVQLLWQKLSKELLKQNQTTSSFSTTLTSLWKIKSRPSLPGSTEQTT